MEIGGVNHCLGRGRYLGVERVGTGGRAGRGMG
jgi:hypothetical protein